MRNKDGVLTKEAKISVVGGGDVAGRCVEDL